MTVRVGRVDLVVVVVELVEVEKRGLSLDGDTVSGKDVDGGSFIACDKSRDDDDDDEEVEFFEREREDVEGWDVSSEESLWSLMSSSSSSRVATDDFRVLLLTGGTGTGTWA